MISKEVIDELKKTHAETFAAKMAVLKDEQMVASVILSQIEQDAKNPPEGEALQRVKAAAGMVLAHANKYRLSRAELEKIIAEVHAQFPDLDIEVLEEPPGMESFPVTGVPGGSSEVVEDLRRSLESHARRNVELEKWLKEAQDSARADQEAVVNLTKERDALEAETKAVRDFIKKVNDCGNIKEVRELLKSMETAKAEETQA
jgi:hypothetical protein